MVYFDFLTRVCEMYDLKISVLASFDSSTPFNHMSSHQNHTPKKSDYFWLA